jgi:hypothetical protein
MDYVEIDSDLLLLAAEGGDMNRKEVVARIQDMKPAERRVLRDAITTLDECFDEAVMDLHLNRK